MNDLLPLLHRPLQYAGPAMLLHPLACALLRLGALRGLPAQPNQLLEACFGT